MNRKSCFLCRGGVGLGVALAVTDAWPVLALTCWHPMGKQRNAHRPRHRRAEMKFADDVAHTDSPTVESNCSSGHRQLAAPHDACSTGQSSTAHLGGLGRGGRAFQTSCWLCVTCDPPLQVDCQAGSTTQVARGHTYSCTLLLSSARSNNSFRWKANLHLLP